MTTATAPNWRLHRSYVNPSCQTRYEAEGRGGGLMLDLTEREAIALCGAADMARLDTEELALVDAEGERQAQEVWE